MHYIFTIFPLAAAAALAPGTQFSNLPFKQTLPLEPIRDVAAGNGLSSIAASVEAAAHEINLAAKALSLASAKFTSGASLEPHQNALSTIKATKAIQDVSNTIWTSAVEVEKKVGSLAISISQQNLVAQQPSLVTAIKLQVQALLNLKDVIVGVFKGVNDQLGAFTDAEKFALTAAIKALGTAVAKQADPLLRLGQGLKLVGLTGLGNVLTALTGSTSAFVSAATNAAAIAPAVTNVVAAVPAVTGGTPLDSSNRFEKYTNTSVSYV
ncbi:hypothetical protein BU23DRAFT_599273 [Bimuria novae-zelandiae CBS 107.79]|uniref:Cell wall protein n=1 Tax=Bimuria novae-zelandiae CBS 107.79 TaxID=1447943 RepID=A0A6A5VAS8_9PLEO|nr:hypothetical protein BU23DRAFT_599273 [Bimuria novae-zelandiae CBS 107.79]